MHYRYRIVCLNPWAWLLLQTCCFRYLREKKSWGITEWKWSLLYLPISSPSACECVSQGFHCDMYLSPLRSSLYVEYSMHVTTNKFTGKEQKCLWIGWICKCLRRDMGYSGKGCGPLLHALPYQEWKKERNKDRKGPSLIVQLVVNKETGQSMH